MANNRIAIAREQQIFVVEESVPGTLVKPAASNVVIAAGTGSINQQPTYTKSPEIVNSRDVLEQFRNPMPPGEWQFPILARASGSAGTAPPGAALYKALMGKEAVNAGTDVRYEQQMQKPSISIWLLKSHSMIFCWGATVGTGRVGLSGGSEGGIMWDFSGQFMGMGWVGTSPLTANVGSGDDTLHVETPENYTVGGYVVIGDDDNGGAGYRITAVDDTAKTLTIAPAADSGASSGDYVTPWVPSGVTVSGHPIEICGSYARFNDIETPVQTMDFTINDAPKYLDDEITAACEPKSYAEVQRDISGALKIYFREKDLSYFRYGRENVTNKIELVADNGPGRTMIVECPKCRLTVPNIEDADPTVALNMNIQALGTDGEDSCSIIWK